MYVFGGVIKLDWCLRCAPGGVSSACPVSAFHIVDMAAQSSGGWGTHIPDAMVSDTGATAGCAAERERVPARNEIGVSCASITCLWATFVVKGLAPRQGQGEEPVQAESSLVTLSEREATACATSFMKDAHLGSSATKDRECGLVLLSEDAHSECVRTTNSVTARARGPENALHASMGMHTAPSKIRFFANKSQGCGFVSAEGSAGPWSSSKHASEGLVAGVSVNATAPSLPKGKQGAQCLPCAVNPAKEM